MNSLWKNAYEIGNILMEMEEIGGDNERIAEMEKTIIALAKDIVEEEKGLR